MPLVMFDPLLTLIPKSNEHQEKFAPVTGICANAVFDLSGRYLAGNKSLDMVSLKLPEILFLDN